MMWMMKKQTVVALVLLLLIPVVSMLGGSGACSDVVAASVLSGDSVQGAILVVAVFRGIGALRIRHPGDAERESAGENGPACTVCAQPEQVCARRLRSVRLRGHMAACLSGHGSQAQPHDHVSVGHDWNFDLADHRYSECFVWNVGVRRGNRSDVYGGSF